LPDQEEDSQETRNIGVAEAFSSPQDLYEEALRACRSMPEPKADPSTAERVVIQVGAFREKANAELLLRELEKKGYDTYLEARITKNSRFFYFVRLRGYASESAARTVIDRLEKEEGLNEPFTLTLDIVRGSSRTPAL
jgi:cell division septation protein DedD